MPIYTFPNIATLQQRGSLQERYQKMHELNDKLGTSDFDIVEVPADFIKNITEEKRTCLSLGSMLLTEEQVSQLYLNNTTDNVRINYILHTEPQLSRTGTKRVTPLLEWYNPVWLENFITHLFNIINHLGQLPYAIEVHPGTKQRGNNTFHSFASAIDTLYKRFFSVYGTDVLIFIENRTGQIIKNGIDMRKFWDYLKEHFPQLTKVCSYVLDVQQLFTVTKHNFTCHLQEIPIESLGGCHIHTKHHVPSIEDEINWLFVADKLHQTIRSLHILPEVHHLKHAEETYLFCKKFLGL